MSAPPGRWSAGGAAALLVVVALVLLMMVSAATDSAVEVGDGFVFSPPRRAPLGDEAGGEPDQDDFELPGFLGVLASLGIAALMTLGVVALLIGLAAVVLVASWFRGDRRRKGASGHRVSTEVDGQQVVIDMRNTLAVAARDAAWLLEHDTDGEPDDAVVAAWLLLEQHAGRAGLGRKPHQTSTEFTVAVLAEYDVDREALDSLRALYLRARYGRDQVCTAQDVAAATAALRRVAADLGAAASRRGAS